MKTTLITLCTLVALVSAVPADDRVADVSKVWEGYRSPGAEGMWPPAEGAPLSQAEKEAGFQSLFNGQDLSEWKAAESPKTFSVKHGELVVKGPRGHLFYTGPVNGATFKNFHLKAQVLTKPKANSGIYVHTAYQEHGWPKVGYECQVNNSGKDPRRTASLYAVKDVKRPVARDNTWFDYEIIVKDKTITIKINGKTENEFTEPPDHSVKGWPMRRFAEGTFALQGHDPGSEVHYRALRVKSLD